MIPLLFALAALDTPPVIVTGAGAVRGASTETVWSFKNIPYAAPPTGRLRWRPPEPPPAWEGERDATQWGPLCPQVNGSGELIGDEDCLQLNVWTPAGPWESLRPVLFWIHGGSHLTGGAASRTGGLYAFDGQRLVEETGVVLVTINYRLGPLGYLAHATLASEQPTGTTGSYGTLDQVAALEWVRRHIAGFGGDPARVTIFGQSAGATSCCALVASPLAAGLFAAAIIQSGSCSARPLAESRRLGNAIFAAAGCADAADPAACMRELPFADVIMAPRAPNYSGPAPAYIATIDGHALRAAPQDAIARGEHNRVPAIVGCTSEEEGGTSLEIATESAYREAIWNLAPVPGADTLILREYPAWEYSSYRAAYVAAASDAHYVCPARRTARAFLAGQFEPVWRYVFTHVADNAAPEVRAQGAKHGADVPYLFDTLARNGYVASDAERALVNVMMRYWSRMAETGAPAPLWPAYDGAETYLRLDTILSVEQGFRRRQCDFWDYLNSIRPPGH